MKTMNKTIKNHHVLIFGGIIWGFIFILNGLKSFIIFGISMLLLAALLLLFYLIVKIF